MIRVLEGKRGIKATPFAFIVLISIAGVAVASDFPPEVGVLAQQRTDIIPKAVILLSDPDGIYDDVGELYIRYTTDEVNNTNKETEILNVRRGMAGYFYPRDPTWYNLQSKANTIHIEVWDNDIIGSDKLYDGYHNVSLGYNVVVSENTNLKLITEVYVYNSSGKQTKQIKFRAEEVSDDSEYQNGVQIIENLTTCWPRATGSFCGNQSASYIKNKMEGYGLDTSIEEFESGNPYYAVGKNVIGVKNGTDLKDQIIIVFAHYDTRAETPGADDDASGVAAILEMTKLFQKFETNRTIYFISFDGEETTASRGAYEWIKKNKDLKNSIVAAVGIDMVGYGNGLQISYISQDSWLKDLFNNSRDLNISERKNPITEGIFSDGRIFLDNNVPVIAIYESTINPGYHSWNDTIENINFSLINDAITLTAQGIKSLASPNDRTPPEVNIQSPVNYDVRMSGYHPIIYNVSENVNGNLRVFIDGMNFGPISSEHTILFKEGIHTLEVQAIDASGNVGKNSVVFEIKSYAEKDLQSITHLDQQLLVASIFSVIVLAAYRIKKKR